MTYFLKNSLFLKYIFFEEAKFAHPNWHRSSSNTSKPRKIMETNSRKIKIATIANIVGLKISFFVMPNK
jgi:hypothetical protein